MGLFAGPWVGAAVSGAELLSGAGLLPASGAGDSTATICLVPETSGLPGEAWATPPPKTKAAVITLRINAGIANPYPLGSKRMRSRVGSPRKPQTAQSVT